MIRRPPRPTQSRSSAASDVYKRQIQCKFYDPAATISKQDIDSFLSESGKHPFRGRIVVTTTDHWGRNAEQAIAEAVVGA
mgnify:CR=1 FL=1